jgi:trigger factor
MQVQVEELSPVEKKVAVEIPWEAVRAKLDRAYKELGAQVTMNGFRKGKIPRAVLEKRFGKHVQTEVTKELVQESLIYAAEQHKIDAVSEPKIEGVELKPGEGFRYQATIEVRAPVELVEIDGLPATRVKIVVPDEDIDKALERKRLQHTEYKPIEGRTTTAPTDAILVSVNGTVGDLPIDRPEAQVDLGDPAHEPLPGLAAALTGIPIDSKDHEITLEMPAEHEHKEIAGQTAKLLVTVKDAREKVVPNLDDEFAKDTGEADTLADLRENVRKDLAKRAGERADRDMREGLVKELVKKNPLQVAPALIERGIDSQIQRAKLSLAMQGVDLEQAGVDLSSMRDRLRDGAADEIRGQLLLEAIADKEKVEVTDEDVDKKIAELAAAQGKRPAKVKGEMLKEGSLDTLRWRLRQEKALDLLTSRATITEVDAPAPAPAPETETQRENQAGVEEAVATTEETSEDK